MKGFGTVPAGLEGAASLAAGGAVNIRQCMTLGNTRETRTCREDVEFVRRNMCEGRDVGAEVLSEDLHRHVGHPVGEEEGVILAETPIVEHL